MPGSFATVDPIITTPLRVLGKLGEVVEVWSYAGAVVLEITEADTLVNVHLSVKTAKRLMANLAAAIVDAERIALAEGMQPAGTLIQRLRGRAP